MKRFLSLCFAAAVLTAPFGIASAQSVQDVMNKFSNEPTVEATMEAAVDYAGLSSDRLESLYRRAGGANALPKSLYYEFTARDQTTNRPQKTYAVDTDENYKYLDYRQQQDYQQHRARAQWDLSKLVYNSEQKSVVSLMSSVSVRRDKLLKDVTKAYYARRKAQIEATMNPPADVASKLESDLKIQELTANLDAMTGGWFSEQLRGNRN